MSIAFKEKLGIALAAWLSLFLSIPVTDALGYSGQGFFLRLSVIIVLLLIAWLTVTYPTTFIAVTVSLLLGSALLFIFSPAFAQAIAVNLLTASMTSAVFRFASVISAVALAVFIMTRLPRRVSEISLLLCGVGLLVPLWYLYVDSAYMSALLYLPALLLWMAYGHGHSLWQSVSPERLPQFRRQWLRYSMAILAAAVIFAAFLPKGFSAIRWTRLQIWADRSMPFLADLRGGETHDLRGDGGAFTVSVAGFGDGVRLGGSVVDDPTVLLEVGRGRSDYLRGSAWQEYTGSAWSTVGALSDWAPLAAMGTMRPLLRSTQVEINHRRLRTVTVFTLPYTHAINDIGRPLYMSPGHTVVAGREVPRDEPYTVRGMIMAYRGASALLDQQSPGVYHFDDWLTLPETVSDEVRDLSLAVTDAHSSDSNKMAALEAHLRQNYEYSKAASPLPADTDFVHFFLFDERKGYCTSFASALAVMGRIVGVPTRYVQGFRMPEKADQDGIYRVTGSDAHAWVEAYIGGLGWMIFEATPAFPNSLSLPLQASPGEPGGGTTDPDSQTAPEREPSFWDEFPFIVDPGAPPAELPPIATQTVRFAPATALAVLALFALSRWRGLRTSLAQVDQLPAGRREIAYYNLTLALLAAMGLGKRPEETPREYGQRINRYVYDWKLDFRRISEGVGDSLYGNEIPVFDTFAAESREFFYSVLNRYLVVSGRIKGYTELYVHQRHLSRQLMRALLD